MKILFIILTVLNFAPNTIQICTNAFNGDIAVAFENTQTSSDVSDFLFNNLFKNQVYSFSTVTRVINVPYPSTSTFGSLVKQWGAIQSLSDYQQNINELSMDSFYTSPTISDALSFIVSNRPNDGVANKILIITGVKDSGVDAATVSLNQLKANGYKVISIAVDNSASRLSAMADYSFNVNDGNREVVAQQVADLICQLGSSPTKPTQDCTTAFQGDIAVAFEDTLSSADVAIFLSNNLFNNQVYSFSTVTRVINVPYPSTSTFGSLVKQWGAIQSLTAYQQNINALSSDSFYTAPTISDALRYLITMRPNTNVANKILIIIGVDDTSVDGATSFLSQLKSQGYTVIAIAVDKMASRFGKLSEHFFTVVGDNGNDVSVQVANLICKLGPPPITTAPVPASDCGTTVFAGNIAVVYELSDSSQDISNFLANYLFSTSSTYNIGGSTNVINVPYSNTDQYTIKNWGDITSLDDYKSNINDFQSTPQPDFDADLTDALYYIDQSRSTDLDADLTKVLIIVGNANYVFETATADYLAKLAAKGFQVIAVSFNNANSNFNGLVSDSSNYVAANSRSQLSSAIQISNILCNL